MPKVEKKWMQPPREEIRGYRGGGIADIGVGIGDLVYIRSGPYHGLEGRVSGFLLDRITGMGPRGPSPMGIAGAKVLKVMVNISGEIVELPPSTQVSVLHG